LRKIDEEEFDEFYFFKLQISRERTLGELKSIMIKLLEKKITGKMKQKEVRLW